LNIFAKTLPPGLGGAQASEQEAFLWMLDVNQELESSNPKGLFLPVDSSPEFK
jgi:hypothetical protein